MKKILSLIISIVLMFSVVGTVSFAATPTTENSYAPAAEALITRSWDNDNQVYTYTVSDISAATSTKNIYGPVKLADKTYAEGTNDRRYVAFKFDLSAMGNIAEAKLDMSASKIDNGGWFYAYAVDGTWEQVLNPETLPELGDKIGEVYSKSSSSAVTRTIDISDYLAQKKAAGNTEAVVYLLYIGSTVRENYSGGFRGYALGATKAPVLNVKEAVEGIGTKMLAKKTMKIYLNSEAVQLNSDGDKNILSTSSSTSLYVNYLTETTEGADAEAYPFSQIMLLKGNTSALAGKNIVSAELAIKGKKYRSAASLRAYMVSSDWNKDEVTYETAPSSTSYKAVPLSTEEANAKVDITSILDTTQSNVTVRLQLYHNGSYNHKQGANIRYAGYGESRYATAPHIVVTYLEEEESFTDSVTFTADLDNEGATVKLLAGIYDASGTLLGIKTSEVLTVGTDALSLDVELADYPTAASVKGFFWNGEGLKPYMEITPAEVSVTQPAE